MDFSFVILTASSTEKQPWLILKMHLKIWSAIAMISNVSHPK
jgi:hypothetical protein